MDIAQLVFEIDSSSAVVAERNLDKLAKTSERVEASARKVKSASEMAGIGVGSLSSATGRATRSATEHAAAAGVVERAMRSSLLTRSESIKLLLRNAQVQAKMAADEERDAKRTASEVAKAASLSAKATAAAERERSAAFRQSQAIQAEIMRERVALARQAEREESAAARAAASASMKADRDAAASATAAERERVAAWRQSQRIQAEIMRERVSLARAAEREEAAAAKAAAAERAEADRAAAAASADLERRIFALKSAIDPAFAAQSRLDAEMREAAALYRMGAISSSDYAKRISQLDAEMAATARGQTNLNGVMSRGAGHSKQLTYAGLNLSRQLSDIGVTAAMGMNPLMILVQQGPQIVEVFQTLKAEGIGVSAALKGMWLQMAPILAVLAPIALAVGAVVAGFGLLHRELSKEYPKDITKGMNLTEEQLKRVKDRTVSFGDTVMATFTVIGRHIMSGPVGDALKWLGGAFAKTMDFIGKTALGSAANIVGAFVGAFEAIKATWKLLPSAIGDLTYSAANGVISGIEFMVNKAIDLINSLITKANGAAKAAGLAINIPSLQGVSLGGIDNPYAGAGAAAGSAAAEAFTKGFASGSGGVIRGASNFAKEIGAEALARARKDALRKVGDAPKGASTPRDQTDERSAQLDGMIAQARAEELNARISITKDIQARADLEKLVLAQELAKQKADLDRQAANIADDKGLSDAKKLELRGQLQIVEDLQKQTSAYKQRAIDEATLAALAREASERASAEAQNQIDLLNSRATLTLSVREQVAISDRIRDLQYADAVAAQKLIIAQVKLGQGTTNQAKMAEDRIRTLAEIHDNDKKIAARQHEMLSAYADAIDSIGSLARSIVDGDIGGSISGLSNTLGKVSKLVSGSLGEALGSAAAFLGPIGAAVSAVTGVLGAIGQVSAAKAQAKLDALNKSVQDLRASNMASSQSIAGALDEANKNWNSDLEYSSQMLTAMRSIDNQIGALANAVGRAITTGGLLDTSSLGLGTTTAGPSALTKLMSPLSWVLPGLYGSKSTTALSDQGIKFDATTFGEVIAKGLEAVNYADLVTTTTKKFLGITYSTKVASSTQTSALGSDLTGQFSAVIAALGNGVTAAASVFGDEAGKAAAEALANAKIDIGKLSLTGLSSSEIEALLNATFSKVGDDLARTAVPGLEALTQAGEGAFEALVRLAREYEVVDTSLASIGKTFGAVGLSSIAARDALVQLFGGIDNFSSLTKAFSEAFLTEAERMAPVQSSVAAELARLGLAADISRDQFKSLVLGLDVSTSAGAEMYAALLNLAPAFDKATTYTQSLADAAADVAKATAAAAAESAKAAADLRTAQQSDAANLLATARANLKTAYDVQVSEIKAGRDQMRGYADSFREFRLGLSGAAASGADFYRIAAKARLGDTNAMGQLVGAAQAADASARSGASTQLEYLREQTKIRAAVQAAEDTATRQVSIADKQLLALEAQVAGFITVNESVLTVAAGISAVVSAINVLNGTFGGAISNQGRSWGANPDANMALVRATGYAGDFGTGGFQSWIEKQDEATKAKARESLTASGQAYRIGFATGGAFTNGIVRRATDFDMGRMGEAGPEAIIPLVQTSGGLGVRSVGGDDGAANEVRALRAEMAAMRQDLNAALVSVARSTAESSRLLKRFEGGGLYVRGEGYGDPVEVKDVA